MKRPMLLLAAIVLCGLYSCNQPAATTGESANSDKTADMKARYKLIYEAFGSGNTAAIDTLLSTNSEDHAADPAMNLPKGPAGLKQMIAQMRQQSPDLKVDMKHVAVDGDILIGYGTMSGTNTGAAPNMPATNKKWSADFSDVVKFGNDMKMTDHWGVYDEAKIMRDMGLMPPHGAMATDTTHKKM